MTKQEREEFINDIDLTDEELQHCWDEMKADSQINIQKDMGEEQ